MQHVYDAPTRQVDDQAFGLYILLQRQRYITFATAKFVTPERATGDSMLLWDCP